MGGSGCISTKAFEKLGVVIIAGGLGGKERMGAGAIAGGSSPKDMVLMDDDIPEE